MLHLFRVLRVSPGVNNSLWGRSSSEMSERSQTHASVSGQHGQYPQQRDSSKLIVLFQATGPAMLVRVATVP